MSTSPPETASPRGWSIGVSVATVPSIPGPGSSGARAGDRRDRRTLACEAADQMPLTTASTVAHTTARRATAIMAMPFGLAARAARPARTRPGRSSSRRCATATGVGRAPDGLRDQRIDGEARPATARRNRPTETLGTRGGAGRFPSRRPASPHAQRDRGPTPPEIHRRPVVGKADDDDPAGANDAIELRKRSVEIVDGVLEHAGRDDGVEARVRERQRVDRAAHKRLRRCGGGQSRGPPWRERCRRPTPPIRAGRAPRAECPFPCRRRARSAARRRAAEAPRTSARGASDRRSPRRCTQPRSATQCRRRTSRRAPGASSLSAAIRRSR